MRTLCPHCNQEYDVTDDFLQQEVSCENCQNNFIVDDTKSCTQCGVLNSVHASDCQQCGTAFGAQESVQSPAEVPPPVNTPKPTEAPPKPSSNLVLAIIAIIFCIPLGIVALIFACRVDSRYQVGDYAGASSSSKIAFWSGLLGTLAAIPTVIFVLAIIAGLLLPAINSSRIEEQRAKEEAQLAYEKEQRISSASNLKQIGIAALMYAIDYKDYFPNESGSKGLEQLRKGDFLDDYNVYINPRSTQQAATSGPLTEDTTSYAYVGAGLVEGGGDYGLDWGDIPIAFEKPWFDKEYINILFMAGHVSGFSGSFRNCEEVVESLRQRDKPNAPVWQKLLANAREIDKAHGK